MTSARLLGALAVSLVLVTGCATGGVAPEQSTPPTSPATTSEPSPTAEPASTMPPPRTSVTCADLIDPDEIITLLGEAPPLADDFAATNALSPDLSVVWIARQLGGLACEWSNGVPYSPTFGLPADYQGVQLRLIPVSAERWRSEFADLYGIEGDRRAYCYAGRESGDFCALDALVADFWWLQISAHGIEAEDDAAALADAERVFSRAEEAVRSAGPPAERTPGTAEPDALPTDCTGMITAEDVAELLGLSEPVATIQAGGGGWGLESEAIHMLGIAPCYWSFLDRDVGVGELSWLPGGEWAYRAQVELAGADATPVQLDGFAEGDEASLMCPLEEDSSPAPHPSAYCTLDFALNGGWIRVVLWPEAEEFGDVPREQAIEAIAQRIVDDLRG